MGLLVPSDDFLKEWSQGDETEQNLEEVQKDSGIRNAISEAVNRANKNLSVIEQVRRFALAEAPFTVDNEMLTPTMKNRRHKILDHYQEQIDKLY